MNVSLFVYEYIKFKFKFYIFIKRKLFNNILKNVILVLGKKLCEFMFLIF